MAEERDTNNDTKEVCNFTDIRRPVLICSSLADFRTLKKFGLKWRYQSPIETTNDGVTATIDRWVLYRLIGPLDSKIEPTDRAYYNPAKTPHWEAIATGNGGGQDWNAEDKFYHYTDEYFAASSRSTDADYIARGRMAVYYRIEAYSRIMSACSLSLFVYCDGPNLVAVSTKNQVFCNKYYSDRSIVWKTTDNLNQLEGSKYNGDFFVRVVVDTADTDFTIPRQPKVKRRVVWATTYKGWVYCFDYFTGKRIGYTNTKSNQSETDPAALMAVALDPMHSMFCLAVPAHVGSIGLAGYKCTGNGITLALGYTRLRSSDWPATTQYWKTIVGAACSKFPDTATTISIIFDNQSVSRYKIQATNGQFSVSSEYNYPKTYFGCIGNMQADQPNLFGIVNGYGREVWTNCHPPLQWAYSYIRQDSRMALDACWFVQGGASTSCYNTYKNSSQTDLAKYLGGDLCGSENSFSQAEKNECVNLINGAAKLLYSALRNPTTKFIMPYALSYRDMNIDRNASLQWNVYRTACLRAGHSEKTCKSNWDTNNNSPNSKVPNPPNATSTLAETISCVFGAGIIRDGAGSGLNKYICRQEGSNYRRLKAASEALRYFNQWASEGFPANSSSRTNFYSAKQRSKAAYNSSIDEVRTLHMWAGTVYGYTAYLNKYTVLQDIGLVYGLGDSKSDRVTNGQPLDVGDAGRQFIVGDDLTSDELPATDTVTHPYESTWREDEYNRNERLTRAAVKYQAFTRPMTISDRKGWIGTAVYYDECASVKPMSGADKPIQDWINGGFFTYKNSATMSDMYVRKPYAGHVDENGVQQYTYSEPGMGSKPIPSQFGIGVSLPSNGSLTPTEGVQKYIIYQTDAIEGRLHKLPRTSNQPGEQLSATTALGYGNFETSAEYPHHVICDDANTVWVIGKDKVERFYPESLVNADCTFHFDKLYINYSPVDPTVDHNNFLGMHDGNLYCSEYYLLSANANGYENAPSAVSKDAAYTVVRGLSDTDSITTKMFDLTEPFKRQYVQGGDDSYYHYEIADKTHQQDYPSSGRVYTDMNEYNEDNLGIAAIRAFGSVPIEDICHPMAGGTPDCHVKVIKAIETNPTEKCDVAIEGTDQNPFSSDEYHSVPLITSENAPSIKESVPSSAPDYDDFTKHLSAHGYDDLSVWHRFAASGLEGIDIVGVRFYAEGNMAGPPDPTITYTEVSNDLMAPTGAMMFTDENNDPVERSSATWEYNPELGTYSVYSRNVRLQAVSPINTAYLWTEPNVRGGAIQIGGATEPNYGDYKTVFAAILSNGEGVYNFYNQSDDTTSYRSSENNYIYVYERWPYPDFCGDGIFDSTTVSDSIWGKCEDEEQ